MIHHRYIFYSLIIIFVVIFLTIINSTGLNTIENFILITTIAKIKDINDKSNIIEVGSNSNTHVKLIQPFINGHGNGGDNSNGTGYGDDASSGVISASTMAPVALSQASLLQSGQSRMNFINNDMNVPFFASSEEKVLNSPTNIPYNEKSMYASAVDFFSPS